MTAAPPNPPSRLEKSLPSSFYLSQEIYMREKDKIFAHDWFCAGRQEQLPEPGDFLVLDVAGESILVVRTKDRKLAAHYNVCRHRGARLCESSSSHSADSGNGIRLTGGVLGPAGIRCPYHQWTYSLDGHLLNAPYLRETDGFVKEDFSLYPVGLATWGGFFFLNLSPDQAAAEGRTLQQQLGAAPDRVQRYPLADLRVGARIEYHVAANWKVIVENYNECYHCAGIHPELCDVVPAFKCIHFHEIRHHDPGAISRPR